MKKLIYILLIPTALFIGFFIGRDFESSETRYWQELTKKVAGVSEKTVGNLGQQAETCFDVLDNKITPKEGEEKLLKLHEEFKQINQEHKSLNEEIGT